MATSQHDVLAAAAQVALQAPSVFNTQPWQWQIDASTLELRADRDRQLTTTDPYGRLLLLSCGTALHHVRVALAAAGWRVAVTRFPDPVEPDLLARVRLVEPTVPSAHDRALGDAISRRRTDRRPFDDESVPEPTLRELAAVADGEGASLHIVRLDQMPMLAIAVASAQNAELADPAYRNELTRWTNRPPWSNDGIPHDTAVAHVARRVPVRDFASEPHQGQLVRPGGDRGASYLIVYGDTDEAAGWLRAGEATSAVLLNAVNLGLAVAPMSDVIEVDRTRDLVRGFVRPDSFPYLVIRCGILADLATINPAPRRDAADAVKGSPPWSTM